MCLWITPSAKNIKNIASNINLNEIAALRRSFLIFELTTKIDKFIIDGVLIYEVFKKNN